MVKMWQKENPYAWLVRIYIDPKGVENIIKFPQNLKISELKS